jgi:hypothetical protein
MLEQKGKSFTIVFMSNVPKNITETVDEAVRDYAFKIVEKAREYTDYNGEIDVDFNPCQSADGKHNVSQATITSEIGVVVVFPNFFKKNATACIVNLGLINAMQMEGFDEEYIEKDGKIYGTLIPQTANSVEIFAHYLTHKIKPDKGY